MPLRPRPELDNLEICYHGGPNYAELEQLGFKPNEVLDFSVSSNPFGPPPEIKAAISSAVIDRYPDSESAEFKRALADHLKISSENIIAGSGSMELIRTIASAYFGKNDTVIIPEPTFGEYEIACQIAGSKVLTYPLREANNYKLSIDDFIRSIQNNRPKAVFLCNPNNPTGQYLGKNEIEDILSACKDSLLILDEAYVNFTKEPWNSMDLINQGNFIIIRSMTKDYALAGLRLGYAVASTDLINSLRKVCPPWNISSVAQQAGIMALDSKDYLRQCQENIRQAKNFLLKRLSHFNLEPLPSQAHFFLLNVGNATQFRQQLLKYGIIVRDCSSFGLPQYIRIAPRTQPECERLIHAIYDLASQTAC